MVTPVTSWNVAALKYDALLAVSTAVWFSLSGNLMNWLLTQPGRRIAARMRSTPSPASTNPVTRRIVPPRGSSFRDDGVGEAAQVIELLAERLGVRAASVGPAEAHDHVGHALLFQPADAVDGVGVHRDHVDLEFSFSPGGMTPPVTPPSMGESLP